MGWRPRRLEGRRHIGAVMPGASVKTGSIETAEMLIDAGVGVKAPYFHRSWVNLPWGTSKEELRHRLAESYKLVRAGLPKKVRAQLAGVVATVAGRDYIWVMREKDVIETLGPQDKIVEPTERMRSRARLLNLR